MEQRSYSLTIQPINQRVPIRPGQTILEALQQAGIHIPADCGGQGVCGHCQVLLVSGEVEPVDESRWTEEEDEGGVWVLACQAKAQGDLVIRLSPQSLAGDLVALSSISAGKELLEEAVGRCYWPLTHRMELALNAPTTEDNLPDLQRIERALREVDEKLPPLRASLSALQKLPARLRENEFKVCAFIADLGPCRELIDITSPQKDRPLLGMAVDIGTSTVVVQLVDLERAQLLTKASATNVQARYGADVITRSIWAEEHEDGPKHMQQMIMDQISSLAAEAAEAAGYDVEQIRAASVAGNTTMTTFALGADARPIRREPHIPLARELPVLHAGEIGLRIHQDAPVYVSPCVSGFVGGDITAGVLATGMAYADELSLLVDVGTNGEIVLGNKDWLMCCSCSAGPAFEGVDIEAGVHAVAGAIDRITYDRDEDAFQWQTIGDQAPIGLCGTGLLEALAAMFRGGLIDRSGHVQLGCGSKLVREGEHEAEVLIVPAEQSGTGQDIVLRESEIDNLIRSKGAIYAGIYCLLDALSLTPEMIERVYIAGAFGNRLRVEEAVTIGMLPDVPRERIAFAGNTSLAGAYLALLCRQARDELDKIAAKMTYLELSATPKFMDEFVAALFLPHTDLSRFPSQVQ